MTKIIVDLNTKVISPQQKIWIVHPGRNRSHIDVFEQEGVVFLEFPGLNLRPAHFSDDGLLRQAIRQAVAIRSNKGLTRDDGSPILASDFPAHAGTDVSVHLRTVRHLATRMSAGDLVIVPSRGAGGRVIFGEVAGDFFPQQTLHVPSLPYAGTPVRRVNWLRSRGKLELPAHLVKFFEKPPAIAEVGRDRFSEAFYNYAYDAYRTDSSSWLSVNAPKYDGSDFLGAVAPAQLIALAVSLYRAIEQDADISSMNYESIVSTFYDESALADAKLRFASPGRYDLKDRDARLARFINGFLALALAGSLVACSAAGNTVEVHEDGSKTSAASGDLSDMVNLATKAPKGVLQKAEDQAANSKAKLGLTVPAKVRP